MCVYVCVCVCVCVCVSGHAHCTDHELVHIGIGHMTSHDLHTCMSSCSEKNGCRVADSFTFCLCTEDRSSPPNISVIGEPWKLVCEEHNNRGFIDGNSIILWVAATLCPSVYSELYFTIRVTQPPFSMLLGLNGGSICM